MSTKVSISPVPEEPLLGPENHGESDKPDLKPSFYGFVASKPKFSHRPGGVPHLFFMAGQEHFRLEPDGTFTKEKTTFHPVVAFRGAAVHGKEKLVKKDYFIAQGDLDTFIDEESGKERSRFIANRIGPDLARTRPATDSTPQGNGIESHEPGRAHPSFDPSDRTGHGPSDTAVGM